jgi:hypothetical protein
MLRSAARRSPCWSATSACRANGATNCCATRASTTPTSCACSPPPTRRSARPSTRSTPARSTATSPSPGSWRRCARTSRMRWSSASLRHERDELVRDKLLAQQSQLVAGRLAAVAGGRRRPQRGRSRAGGPPLCPGPAAAGDRQPVDQLEPLGPRRPATGRGAAWRRGRRAPGALAQALGRLRRRCRRTGPAVIGAGRLTCATVCLASVERIGLLGPADRSRRPGRQCGGLCLAGVAGLDRGAVCGVGAGLGLAHRARARQPLARRLAGGRHGAARRRALTGVNAARLVRRVAPATLCGGLGRATRPP